MRHLIDSADWGLEEIEELWNLTRRLRRGEELDNIDQWFAEKTTPVGRIAKGLPVIWKILSIPSFFSAFSVAINS